MNRYTVDDWIADFSIFKTRVAAQFGQGARILAVIAKDGQGQSLPVNDIAALSRQFSAALDEGWIPVALFVLGKQLATGKCRYKVFGFIVSGSMG